MKRYTKAESFRVNMENKTNKILLAIGSLKAFAHIRSVPFPEGYATDIANAIRKAADELESDLLELSRTRRPFRLSDSLPAEEENN